MFNKQAEFHSVNLNRLNLNLKIFQA